MIDNPDATNDSTQTLSNAVTVSVKTQFLSEQSKPSANRYAYRYEITITNNSKIAVQLMNRHWLITEEAELPKQASTKEIKGTGVIGQQPIIQPTQSFSYASGAIIASPIGTMAGEYEMQTLDGSTFNISIPTFTLIQPHKLH